MKLTIDQIPCDLDPSQRIALDYDAQDLADVRSGNKGHALRLRLPATRTNDRIFGFAAEPYTGQRFNAAQHTAVLSDGEAKLLQGSVRLLSAAYDSDPEGYLIEIRSGTTKWGFKKLLKYGWNGILAFSTAPHRALIWVLELPVAMTK